MWPRGIAFVLVGLLGLVSFVIPHREASADPHPYPCWWEWVQSSSSGTWHRQLHCEPLQVKKEFLDLGGCPPCGWQIDWKQEIESPDWVTRVNSGIGQGLVNLGRAAFATNPTEQANFRSAALNSFGLAAFNLHGSRLSINAVGVGDPQRNTFAPRQLPWLTAAANNIVGGIQTLQVGGSQATAAAQLQRAYDQISTEQVG